MLEHGEYDEGWYGTRGSQGPYQPQGVIPSARNQILHGAKKLCYDFSLFYGSKMAEIIITFVCYTHASSYNTLHFHYVTQRTVGIFQDLPLLRTLNYSV